MLITLSILIQIIFTTLFYIYFDFTFIAVDIVITAYLLRNRKKQLVACLIIILLTIIRLNSINTTYNKIQDGEVTNINAVVVNMDRNNQKYIIKPIGESTKFLMKTSKTFKIGDIINVRSKVYKPYTNGNPYMFNYKFYLLKNNIYGDLYPNSDPKLIGTSTSNLIKIRRITLDYIANKFDYNFDKTSSKILKSIFTGYNFLDENYKDDMKSLGISHVFAISGLHILIIYGTINKLLSLFNVNRKIIAWISIILIGLYAYVVGFPASILRAFIMLFIVELSNQLQIDWYDLNNLSIAAIILLILNPYNLFDAGFLFSFAATFTIIYLYPKIRKKKKPIYNYLIFSFAIYIMLIPIQLRFFNEYSFGFLIGNTILLPVFTLIIQCSFIVLLIPNKINYIFVLVSKLLLKLLGYMMTTISLLHIHTHNLISFSIIMSICFYCILFTIYNWHYVKLLNDYNKKILTNMLAMAMFIPLILSIINPISIINFVDVGQGDCILVRQINESFMIDTGGSYKDDDKSGEYLVEYLKKIGVRNLKYVFLTHFDEDHSKNLIEINRSYNPVVLSRNGGNHILRAKYNQNNKYIPVSDGEKFKIDNIKLKIFHNPISNEENDNSVVYKLYVNNLSVLITGDISQNYEKNLANYNIKSDILKISHHGSKNSSDISFLKKVNPKLAVISVGLRNSYNHPSPETIDKLENLDIPVKRTDLDGNIEIVSSVLMNSLKANRDKFSLIHFIAKEQNSLISVIIILLYYKSRRIDNGFFIGKTKIR